MAGIAAAPRPAALRRRCARLAHSSAAVTATQTESPDAATRKWQTWRCIDATPPGSAMKRVISDRQYWLGSVPVRSCNTLNLRRQEANSGKELPFTGFELLFLGTSAGSPSVRRNPTAVCLRTDKSNWMFDCAEASLRQLMKSTVRVPTTDKFFVTHLHGDHVYGLPGMLCTLDNHNDKYTDPRTRKSVPRPISVYGPLGLFSYLNTAFMTSTTRLVNLVVTVHELVSPDIVDKASAFEKYASKAPMHPSLRRELIYAGSDGNGLVWKVFEDEHHKVVASALKHTVMSFGYVVEEHEQPGKLRPELLIARGLRPGPDYRQLKQGKSLTLANGNVIHPDEVTGPPTRGRKVVILGDTADSSRLFDIGRNCDVLVHEATLSHEMVRQAVQRGHSTARMAGYTAKRMNATLLALTHFSHRFRHWAPSEELLATTQHLAMEAQVTFGRRAVIPASDFLRIPIPRQFVDQ